MTRISALLLSSAIAMTFSTANGDDHGPEKTIISTASTPIEMEKRATLSYPWGMAFLPDGDLLITEKPGALYIYNGQTLSDPIKGLPKVAYKNQGGLLDIAVDPDFENNNLVYLFYVERSPEQPENPQVKADPRLGPYVDESDTVAKRGVVQKATLRDGILYNSEIIWRQNEDVVGLGHFGGRLLFADDGTLLITSGERQRFSPSQDMQSNLGKVIRITTSGIAPDDNPYVDDEGVSSDIWSSGHRNPLGIAIRPQSGEVYVSEMGPLYGDELNKIEVTNNYGWPIVSNGENYDLQPIDHHETAPEEFTSPEFYWRPAISPSGLMFYDGDLFADWKGNAFIGGLSSEALIRVTFDGDVAMGDERINVDMRVRDVEQAPDGSIYILTDYEDGGLYRLVPHVVSEEGMDE